jgi:hypothetical protein
MTEFQDARSYFDEMFAAEIDDDFHNRFRMYEHDSSVGAPPYWPPLSGVWAAQGVPPDYDADSPQMVERWRDAWSLLQKLHGEWMESRKRRA